MLRSCLLLLATYLLLVFGYAWWLGWMFDPPGQYIGAAVVALIVGGCLGTLYNARTAYREWSLVSAARAGLPWSDGRWAAALGEIHPLGEPLTAPFSGEECVLCEYDVASRSRVSQASRNENSNPGSDFTGFLMNPCVVRSAAGEMRLLGFPNLVGFGERICDSTAAAQRAREFLTSNELEDFSGLKMVTVFSAIKAAWSDDDGLVRKNIRLCKKSPLDLFPFGASTTSPVPSLGEPATPLDDSNLDEDAADDEGDYDLDDEELDGNIQPVRPEIPLLKEKRVKVGENVCAIGIYSGQRGGLIPAGLGADHFIKLIRGRAVDIERLSRGAAIGRFFGGLIFLVLVNAATYGVLLAARRDPEPAAREARQLVESGGDPLRLAKLLGRGVDVNARDEFGWTMLMLASRGGHVETARVLLAAGADVKVRTADGVTALTLAQQRGHAQIAELLQGAGAGDDAPNAVQP
jgi:hypothetical protein